MAKGSLVDSLASGRERRTSVKASHRGHGGHRGGLRLDGGRLFGGQLGFWAGKRRIRESIAQRSRRSQRGIEDWTVKGSLVDSLASGREGGALG